MTRGSTVAAAIAALALGACVKASPPEIDPGLYDLFLTDIHPDLIVPGSSFDLAGRSFVDVSAGLTFLHVTGKFTPTGGGEERTIDVELPAQYVDAAHLTVPGSANLYASLGGAPGQLAAAAYIAVDSAVDHNRHTTPALPFTLNLSDGLTAKLDGVTGGDITINQNIAVTGGGFLLGGGEGETRAILDGCFLPMGRAAPCATNGLQVKGVEVAVRPAEPWSRTKGLFSFSPAIAGIHPGVFSGTVAKNVPPSGATATSPTRPLDANLTKGRISSFSPTSASLGQFVDVKGAGFIGGIPGTVTLVRLVGEFKPEGSTKGAPVDLMILPRFVAGDRLRYVLDEADLLGHLLNLRQIAGTFTGNATPIMRAGEDEEVGNSAAVTLSLAHVKQVVYLHFDPSYVDSLRLYGLRAADQAIRDRVLVVARRDYLGVNLEFRTVPPTDFALFSQVDILGPDPNGLGLFGYDNTPGKDTSNSRLYDRIGGVNATTQEDGSPGYGGVFAEQFLGFSAHPPSEVGRLPLTAESFDPIFDPFRPDVGGIPITPTEIADAPTIDNGDICPPAPNDRPAQIACAVFVLGNLIGTTLTHETGHSLGLANPFGDGFHDVGDLPNRLMEGGADRPFDERAELGGQGPGRFCDTEWSYLQSILPPAPNTDPKVSRPPCE